jgi:TctA family transporter
MAKQGRAGPALGMAAIASFVAGTISTLVVALFSPPLAEIALSFQPADYFSLMVFGLVGAVVLARGSLRKAIAMVIVGLLLGLVGTDVNSGQQRFTLGIPALAEGISFAALAMGMFGVAEVIYNLEQRAAERQVVIPGIGRVMPTLAELRYCLWSIARGTGLGSLLGILPGGGALLASFAAYTVEKKVARAPRTFGHGDIRGVAAPEAANNAGAQTSFIPMLTLGVPANPTMALMIGALMIQGIQPGPQAMLQRPELFWGLVASMWIGNLFLLLLNLPLVGLWVRLLAVPYRLLFPAILMFCCIGVFSINNNAFDLFQLVVFSALGYVLLKLGCEPAPLILGLVLGPMMEEYLRRALLISLGDPMVLVTSPLSAAFLFASLVLLVSIAVPMIRAQREVAMKE